MKDEGCARYTAEMYADLSENPQDKKKISIEIDPDRMVMMNHNLASDLAYDMEKGLDGFTRNYSAAYDLFTTLIEKKDEPRAYNNLGWMYQRGLGVEKDTKKALDYYQKAADKGDTAAMVNIGNYYEASKDYKEAGKWYLLAALSGNQIGALNYGNLYHWGWGVEQNYELAYKIFMHCYIKKYKRGSCYYLGRYAEEGFVGKADPALAAKYYTEGGEAGDPDCYTHLGLLYLEGKGVEKDEQKAFSCFVAAARMGDPEAYKNMAECLKDGRGVEKNEEHARKFMERAKAIKSGAEE
jgi:hypothetical protein